MKSFVFPALAFGASLVLGSSLASAMVPAVSVPGLSSAPIVHVAHAGAPYKNVDKRNDAGNDTGDDQTAKLNDDSLAKAKGQK